jgi:hypothetical protein
MPHKLSQVGIGIADPGTVTMENIEDGQTQLPRLNIVPLLKLTDMRNSVLMGGLVLVVILVTTGGMTSFSVFSTEQQMPVEGPTCE